MKKYYIELQDEPKACGAYCIYMIFKYYHIHVELKDIKERCRMDSHGISMRGLIECLHSYHIEAKGYYCPFDQMNQIHLPCILHYITGQMGHYVVLYEIKDDHYIIGDPFYGLVTLSKEELLEKYSSHLISITHVGRNEEKKEKTYLSFVKESFSLYRDDVFLFLKRGLLISLLGLGSYYLFQVVIDFFHPQTHYFYMILFSFAYFLLSILKIIYEKKQSQHFLQLQRFLDEDYCFDSMKNMLYKTDSLINQDKTLSHHHLLSLNQLSEMNVYLFQQVLLNGFTFILFFITMFFIHPFLVIPVMIMMVVIVIYMKNQVPVIKKLTSESLEGYHQFYHHLYEWIDNLFMIKRYQQKHLIKRYHHIFEQYENQRYEKEKKEIQINTISSCFIQICILCVFLLGFYFYKQDKITIGDFILFYMLLNALIPLFLSFLSLFFEFYQLKQIYERYKSFSYEYKEKEKIKEPIKRIVIDDLSYSFGYRQELFSHIDLKIENSLYLLGDTGSGKSTLLSLIMGCDLHYSGNIYFNDQELRNLDLSSLYEHVGYECQTPTFLHASLYDNFLSCDEEKMMMLLKGFGCEELIEMKDCLLNEDGYPLSLGQRQVIALVRLFLRDYDVYILDEVFSHMDNKIAGKIYRYIVKNYKNKILIMVNHQTKLVNKKEDYVIIDKGNLIKKGDKDD